MSENEWKLTCPKHGFPLVENPPPIDPRGAGLEWKRTVKRR